MLFILRQTPGYRAVLAISLHVTIAFLFSGCKFAPLYGESSAGDARFLKLVKIERIENRSGQKLRTILKQKFGQRSPPAKPRWSLTVKISQEKRRLALRQDSTTTRREVTVTATFILQELNKSNNGMLKGNSFSMSSFNELGSKYAMLVAERDALDRSLSIIANDLRNRIMLAIRHPKFFEKPGAN